MEFIQQVLRYLAVVAAFLLVVGLYKPWVVLWWEDKQNRKKVIRLYGGVTGFALLSWWVLNIIDKQQ